MIGRTLSHYRIVEKLGEGGMGVVYRAVDTRLDRPVAIKVLPQDGVDKVARLRFAQEARTASSLNHPNIITVHDVGAVDGVEFIAMEYVTGSTLGSLIGRSGLGVKEAVRIAVQIADAVAAAHAAAIVHRDLKPANVMVTDKGLVKVLDFGLAKSIEPPRLEVAIGQTTVADAAPRTEAGAILGTVAYMSPEQAEGKRLDARSDIFSFGSLLYEMVTGQRAFQRETTVATLSAILQSEPVPAIQIAEGVPPELDNLIAHCLRKEPDRRFQHLDDVKTLLGEMKQSSGASTAQSTSHVTERAARSPVALVGVVAIVLTVGWIAWSPIADRLGARDTPAGRPRVSTGGPASTNPEANRYFEASTQYNGDYPSAKRVGTAVLERLPLFFPNRMVIGEMLRQEGDLAGAIREQEKILEQDAQSFFALTYLARYRTRRTRAIRLALEGRREEALKEMDGEVLKWEALVSYETSEAADFYAVLGDANNALEWLSLAVSKGDERAEWFRRDSLLANIRNEPRFQQIIESIAYRRQQRKPTP